MRTLTGKELELIGEMKRYQLDVLGVGEGKIRGNEMKTGQWSFLSTRRVAG